MLLSQEANSNTSDYIEFPSSVTTTHLIQYIFYIKYENFGSPADIFCRCIHFLSPELWIGADMNDLMLWRLLIHFIRRPRKCILALDDPFFCYLASNDFFCLWMLLIYCVAHLRETAESRYTHNKAVTSTHVRTA